ncbi:MAG TPA: serine hydrolase domain-containing protein [Candidatus Binataceae bacterium]|nr:serine hydrolase domain-containing protein [Candidatus Binataceae bacterium]
MPNSIIAKKIRQGVIEGECDPKFEGVLDAFVANFEHRDELGASVCLNVEGRTVVDLWGGRVKEDGLPWTRDTVSIIFSATKGASALCAHMAADRGQLDLDAPVTRYWPNFGKSGKESALVTMMLDHSVGLPHVRTKVQKGGFYDYDYMIKMLEDEEPFWKPGIRNGYHGITSAWTVGEMVHRSTGKRLGKFFQEEVAKPLGLDFHIGLPAEQEQRVAPMIFAPITDEVRNSRVSIAAVTEKDSATHYFMFNMGGFDANSREAHAAEIGSANGISNGRGLAGMYAPLANGGELNGVRLVGRDTLQRMALCSVATHEDATLRIPTRFSLGFMKAMDNRKLDNAAHCSLLIGEPAFGHVGAGGSLGFADPECRMSFGYTMNRMGFGILMNDRGQSLVDAAYRALGYRSNASGVWAR